MHVSTTLRTRARADPAQQHGEVGVRRRARPCLRRTSHSGLYAANAVPKRSEIDKWEEPATQAHGTAMYQPVPQQTSTQRDGIALPVESPSAAACSHSTLASHAVQCTDALISSESDSDTPSHSIQQHDAKHMPWFTRSRRHTIKLAVGIDAGCLSAPAGFASSALHQPFGKRRVHTPSKQHTSKESSTGNHQGTATHAGARQRSAKSMASNVMQSMARRRMHKPAAHIGTDTTLAVEPSSSKTAADEPRSDTGRAPVTSWRAFWLLLAGLLVVPAAVQFSQRTSNQLASLAAGFSGMAKHNPFQAPAYAAAIQAVSSLHGQAATQRSARPLHGGHVVAAAAAGANAPSGSGKESSQQISTAAHTAGSRQWLPTAQVRVLAIIPEGADSPYKATWDKVMVHTAKRLTWNNAAFQMLVFTEQELAAAGIAGDMALREFKSLVAHDCQVLLGGGLTNANLASKLSAAASVGQLPSVRVFMPAPAQRTPSSLQHLTSLQGYAAQNPGWVEQMMSKMAPWSNAAKSAELWHTVQDLWSRHTSDDLLFVLLVLINQYITPVREVAETTKGMDLDSLRCMVTFCRQQIMDCVNTPQCKKGLDCMQGCAFNDQVCQYRCIVSYETPQFSEFALCIIQKHNCRNLNAQPPAMPDPAPMSTFRGAPLTHETAEAMFLAWMQPEVIADTGSSVLPYSWLVAAGKNPAYDFFPCQHQLFYKGKGKGVLWYEPVFKAITLDGKQVWRRRRYRVKRGETPGTFHFSVLDNGVTSKEYWRILDCDDSYEWCLFYYSGAASAAGLSYSGAVLGTHDGRYPVQAEALTRLEAALDRGGIQPWELSFVDNSDCVGAPLELSEAMSS